jgi:cell division protein FtsA
MPRQIVTGLDVGSSSIRVVVSEYTASGQMPQVLALVRKESRGLRQGYVVNREEAAQAIGEAIREAEQISQTKIRHICLAVGGITLESKVTEGQTMVARADLEVASSDIARAVEASESTLPDATNRRVIHQIPIDFKLDGKKIYGRPEGMHGNKLEAKVLYISCYKQHLSDLMQAVQEAGCVIDEIIASPLAASFVTLSKVQKMAGCVLANIGSQTTSIVVFEDGNPISLHVFGIGSTNITNDIALGLRIPLENAERIKRGEEQVVGPRKKLDEIVEARLSDIFEYIETHLKKIGRAGLLPAGITITGGGSSALDIDDLAKNFFRLPSRVVAPNMLIAGKPKTVDPAWAVAYGLCLIGPDLEVEEKFGAVFIGRAGSQILRWFRELWP